MKVEGEYEFEAPRDLVWEALMDPVVLASTLPGCDKLEMIDGQYQGVLNVKVGPVQGRFNGKIDLLEPNEPESYKLKVDGRGAPGFVKADAFVQLKESSDGTKIIYEADAKVGGKVASVGQRLLDASARAIIKQSLEGLNETMKDRAAHRKASEEAAAAPSEAGAAGEAAAARAVAPAPEPHRVTEAQLAAAVAKEVTKTLFPPPVIFAIVLVVLAVAGVVVASLMN